MGLKRGGGHFGSSGSPVPALHVKTPIAAIGSVEGVAFSYTIPRDTFSSPNAKLDVSTTAVQNSTVNVAAFPAWLKYDSSSHTLYGTPPVLGTYRVIDVLITATGKQGQSAIQTFSLVTEPPITVGTAVENKTNTRGVAFTYVLAGDTFAIAAGNTHPWRGMCANGDPLPNWLWFQDTGAGGTIQFWGYSQAANSTITNPTPTGVYTLRVTARSGQLGQYPTAGQDAHQDFTLTVS